MNQILWVPALVAAVTLAFPGNEARPSAFSPSRAMPPVSTPDQDAAGRADYLTFALGAIPLSVGGAGAAQGADLSHALLFVDGAPGRTSFLNRATDETDVEFVYELPAATTFDRFAVPDVLETPSPSQTFVRTVEVYGSATGPDDGFELLAAGVLSTHDEAGQATELDLVASIPVRWVKLRMVGGIDMAADLMFLEFGEIVGNGAQDVAELVDHFDGSWRGRGVFVDLAQNGAAVVGCYDRESRLEGTVTGNLLRAAGTGLRDGVVSLFILARADDGSIRGVRSSNGAPFRLYEGAPTPDPTGDCPEIEEPVLGCGSVIHGITFAFDSAEIRADSEPVLALLFDGLEADPSSTVTIEGHTSSEGSDAYNLELSQRRAQAVVDDLVGRGIGGNRLTPAGRGESVPIAPNDDESGRSMNRRVEVHCGE